MKLLPCAALFLLLSLPALAQRQTPGRPSVEGSVLLGVSPKFAAVGGSAFWCNHYYGGHTVLGLDVLSSPHRLHEDAVYASDGTEVAPALDHSLTGIQAAFVAGYRFRLIAPRSRVFILSGGADILVGAKYCEEMGSFVKSDGNAYAKTGFFLGAAPELKAEVFPFRNVSLFVAARPRVRILCGLGGSDDWFTMSLRAGVAYYL